MAEGSRKDSLIDIVNSYDNTEELLAKYPVINRTPVDTELEKNIENRLLTGFENWNRGYDAWKAWGDILNTPDSIYNVHGARMTLKEYQDTKDVLLKQTDIRMGDFHNMLIRDNWAAIHYRTVDTNLETGEKTDGDHMQFLEYEISGDDVKVIGSWEQ